MDWSTLKSHVPRGWSPTRWKLTMAGLACGLVLALPLMHGKYGLGTAIVFLALFAAPLLPYLAACRSTAGAIAIGLGYALSAGLSATYLAWEIAQPIQGGPAPIGQGLGVFIIGGGQHLALWLGMAMALAVEWAACRLRRPRASFSSAMKPGLEIPRVKDLQPAPTKVDRKAPPASLESTDFASRWITVPVGIGLGSLLAAIAGGVLAVVLWLPPFGYWFGFYNEFDLLLLVALPILAAPGGAISGAIAGYARRVRYVIPLIAGSAPVVLFFCLNAWTNVMYQSQLEQFLSTLAISLGMLGATAISLRLTRAMFRMMDRRRARPPMNVAI